MLSPISALEQTVGLRRFDEVFFREHPVLEGQVFAGELVAEQFIRMLPDHRPGDAGREGFGLNVHGFRVLFHDGILSFNHQGNLVPSAANSTGGTEKFFQLRCETNLNRRGLKKRSKPRLSQAMSEPRIEPYNPPAIGSRAAWSRRKTNYEDQTYLEGGLYAG